MIQIFGLGLQNREKANRILMSCFNYIFIDYKNDNNVTIR